MESITLVTSLDAHVTSDAGGNTCSLSHLIEGYLFFFPRPASMMRLAGTFR